MKKFFMGGESELMLFRLAVDKIYAADRAMRMSCAKRVAALQCRYLGGNIPYGFAVDEKTHEYAINEDEAENVRTAYAMIAGGASYGSVLRYLCKVGAKTRAGSDFSYASLQRMLQNEQYNGMFIYNKRGPVDKQIRIPGGMPRIVDAETFAVVQAVLAA